MNSFAIFPYCFYRYYKCLNYEKKCPGRAIKYAGKKARMSKAHDDDICEPRPDYAKRRQFHQELMRACSSPGNQSTSLTYSDLAKRYVFTLNLCITNIRIIQKMEARIETLAHLSMYLIDTL